MGAKRMTPLYQKKRFEEIFPGIWRATLPIPGRRPGPVNVYLFTGAKNVLVDTGARNTATLARELFRNSGFDLKNLHQIIATHGHLDHYGAARRLIEWSHGNAHLAAHQEDVSSIRYGREAPLSTYVFYFKAMGVPVFLRLLMLPLMFMGKVMAEPCPVEHLLKDGDIIRIGNYDALVVSVPGHTRGSICLYIPSRRILVAGDHILSHITPNAFVMLERKGLLPIRLSQEEYYRSLEKVLSLSPKIVLPAHGEMVTHIGEVVSGYKRSFEQRKAKLFDIVRSGEKTVYLIARRLFPELGGKRFSLDLFLAISETYSHLQILEKEGKIIMEMGDGQTRVERGSGESSF